MKKTKTRKPTNREVVRPRSLQEIRGGSIVTQDDIDLRGDESVSSIVIEDVLGM